jgi:predicted  nucleic acid-binding Zn-ribbon protein
MSDQKIAAMEQIVKLEAELGRLRAQDQMTLGTIQKHEIRLASLKDEIVRLRGRAGRGERKLEQWRLGDQVVELEAENERLRAALGEIASQCHNLPRSATADRIERTARAALERKPQP